MNEAVNALGGGSWCLLLHIAAGISRAFGRRSIVGMVGCDKNEINESRVIPVPYCLCPLRSFSKDFLAVIRNKFLVFDYWAYTFYLFTYLFV